MGLDATYTVQPVKLELLAHVILTVQQILSSLSELRGIPPCQAFHVDPSYAYVRSLEGEPSSSRLELMWETLVQRLLHSHENIEAQLRTLYHFFTEPDARLSQISFNSTEGELRLVYSTRSPRTELAHFWHEEEKCNKLPTHLKIHADQLAASLLADGYSVPSYHTDSAPIAKHSSLRPAISKQIQFKETPDIAGRAIAICPTLLERTKELAAWEILWTMGATDLEGTTAGRISHEVDGRGEAGILMILTSLKITEVVIIVPGEEALLKDPTIPMIPMTQMGRAADVVLPLAQNDGNNLDEMMKSDIAQIDWFTTLPLEARRVAMSSFDKFILCLWEHFMDVHWIDECTIEYKEMCFWQPGHTKELPLQFIQCCLKYSCFLFSENNKNNVGMVHRILRAQPACWAIHLNTKSCNTVVELLHKLKTREAEARHKTSGPEEGPGMATYSSTTIPRKATHRPKIKDAGYAPAHVTYIGIAHTTRNGT
ncbi:hypothetical protein BDN71DRAFT_1432267 [Pleurotus eryngii]|uniref:Uncharacterized protein n=1 Tax=Pleurotus eryngii TaxID=5323 RepID=A0A9P5ZT56_PLEER|nr:hypothetical protein BDN71DRAFT_1432267 [Pleurotus eryngii]